MMRYTCVSLLCMILCLSAPRGFAQDASLDTLLKAITEGDEAKVKTLLEGGSSPTAAAGDGVTPLHAAAYAGSKPITDLLLERGADVNAKASGDIRPLHIAAERCSDRVIPTLLEAGATLEAVNGEGATALHMAAMAGCMKAVPQLIAAGAKVTAAAMNDLTPLHVAVQSWNEKTITALLDAGAVIDAVTTDGYTPLHVAVMREKWKAVDLLLERGADVDLQDGQGETPLHLILKADFQKDRATKMIEKTRAPNRVTKNGVTAVYIAAAQGAGDLLSLLLAKGADPNLKDSDGIPPLAVARFEGRSRAVEVLEAAGAVDADAFFYLYNAALQGRADKLRKALKMEGAKDAVTRTAAGGVTPLHAAAHAGCEWCIIELLEAGWAVDAKDGSDNTPLHMAVVRKERDACRILVAAGASLAIANKDKTTPLQYAEQLGIGDVLTKQSLTPALIAAAEAGEQGPIDAFLDAGGDPQAHDYRRTLLYYILKFGHMDLAEHLRSRGADLDFAAPATEPYLHMALRSKNRVAVDWLLTGGANLHSMGRLGARPLHVAVAVPWREGVEVLLQAGADVNEQVGPHGVGVLHYAVLGGDVGVVGLLLGKGADPTLNVKPEGTPLHWAGQEGKVDIARLLIDAGADVNAAVEEYAGTPLHEAASTLCSVPESWGPWHPVDEEAFCKGKPAVVALLLERGASHSPLTNYGATPLDNAGDPEVIRLLEAVGAASPLRDKRNKK
jgi:ankyrin repeat protein